MTRNLGVTEWVRRTLPEWAVPVFEAVTLLGDVFVVVAVLLAVAVADVGRSYRQGNVRPLRRRTAFVLGVVLGGLALTLILKAAFGLPRPPASVQAQPSGGDGFPSGHTMAAAILWCSLAYWLAPGTRRARWTGAAAIVALVGVSRLALGVHYLVDVLASVGFALGYLALVALTLRGDPRRAFALACVLGTLALFVTAARLDGLLAFVGCVGGAVAFWITERAAVVAWWRTQIR